MLPEVALAEEASAWLPDDALPALLAAGNVPNDGTDAGASGLAPPPPCCRLASSFSLQYTRGYAMQNA